MKLKVTQCDGIFSPLSEVTSKTSQMFIRASVHLCDVSIFKTLRL